ncbi:hypothetical protein [Chromobacterium piscinae]|uniref:hypothetical protein n=1 Tax=Chromobacterium piscinae TaxID=686831 RepID=UPI003F7E76B6
MKTLLITGGKAGAHAIYAAAHVAAQLALQHHNYHATIVSNGSRSAAAAPIQPAGRLRIVACDGRAHRLTADAVINLDQYLYPNGRQLTFHIRETVDHLVAGTPPHLLWLHRHRPNLGAAGQHPSKRPSRRQQASARPARQRHAV